MSDLRLHGLASPGLQPWDLELPAGACTALHGPSGSGKSRLLRAIADLDPHQGEAQAGPLIQSATPPPTWRRQVALLPAESHWWGERVADHFPDAPEQALPWLQRLALPAEALRWEVARLSSGERQRLALARLLGLNPQVLLLDEPTANLDAENIQRVEALIADYRRQQQAAVLWVSHDPAQRRRVADRGYRIQDQRLEQEPWN
jgi:ABC-type iron transport system FetAB ATPase subunit